MKDNIDWHVRDQVRSHVMDQVRWQIWDQVEDQIRDKIQVRNQFFIQGFSAGIAKKNWRAISYNEVWLKVKNQLNGEINNEK